MTKLLTDDECAEISSCMWPGVRDAAEKRGWITRSWDPELWGDIMAAVTSLGNMGMGEHFAGLLVDLAVGGYKNCDVVPFYGVFAAVNAPIEKWAQAILGTVRLWKTYQEMKKR